MLCILGQVIVNCKLMLGVPPVLCRDIKVGLIRGKEKVDIGMPGMWLLWDTWWNVDIYQELDRSSVIV